MRALTVMRHGPAEPGFGGDDSERALTADAARIALRLEYGEALMRRAAAGLRQPGFDLGVTSPYLRAARTAELIWEELGLVAPLISDRSLAAGAGPEEHLVALEAIWRAHPRAGSVLLVGHMPDVAQLTAHLLEAAPPLLPFVPGGAARLRFDAAVAPGAGRLEWMLRPEELAGRARQE